jgi:hypothetical protein
MIEAKSSLPKTKMTFLSTLLMHALSIPDDSQILINVIIKLFEQAVWLDYDGEEC